MKKQLAALVAGIAVAVPALADVELAAAVSTGFYGGVSLREGMNEAAGLSFGHLKASTPWNRFGSLAQPESGSGALAYGGFRWANDVAVEAALASSEQNPANATLPGARRGVGLSLDGERNLALRNWNVDVYTSWSMRPRFALYGRLGYVVNDASPAYAMALQPDAIRNRDGVNYGLGLRYDMSSALGLRLEYARFGRLPGEAIGGLLPESDQVRLGVQFRF